MSGDAGRRGDAHRAALQAPEFGYPACQLPFAVADVGDPRQQVLAFG